MCQLANRELTEHRKVKDEVNDGRTSVQSGGGQIYSYPQLVRHDISRQITHSCI
jgi:hypothetical protein